ncbi:SUF system Fe-S cluster assembly protein [Trinickia caryophylli]|uniref:FeS assembly SUF system protein n=1 Tax=Trinickia caryophylli TaxID=28094 RepID=A0A1X7DEA2_TRICW|nr:SUF system Fe-S cluster assembly protein [Trinickia caryophylli]PMS09835.1 SUF system Fe-S cluster assembly protein [Trinickia caryophylli]TRX16869.1 SUF system Fe-S cluster assembly protein [Trinickia caryophylli]WQE12401.1 SUF system Fe-S cluster assembly protein [Trinickia caryophylli]SMF14015.1 FeS assembly SUF system protein [Trinickia caryophylli]GLU31451.1 SUF system Fe-S cluster assembly protein [Trinickia caryophylli]
MKAFDEAGRLGEATPTAPTAPIAAPDLRARVIEALRTVFDPEIPVNIYDLGLIYGLDVDEQGGHVAIRMTLTAPGCPVAQTFPGVVGEVVASVEGVHAASVELVWEPAWSQARMSEAARLQLGLL